MRSVHLDVERSTSTAHRLLHYDGVCSDVHGHNFEWVVSLELTPPEKPDNMTVDFKDVSDTIDTCDHALMLSFDDPLAENREDWTWLAGDQSYDSIGWTKYKSDVLGQVILFDGDPTCEVVSEWMSEHLCRTIEPCLTAHIELSETEKYSVTGAFSLYDEVMKGGLNE